MTLTREQVEKQRDDARVVIIKLDAETAALRQEITDLQDQARQRRLTPDGYCSYCAAYAAGWLTECTNPIHTDGLPRLVELRQELEEAQQRYETQCAGTKSRMEETQRLRQRVKEQNEMIKNLVAWQDTQLGTPCEQIRHAEQMADLTAKLAKMQHECDEHVENLSRCKGNELAQQVAELTEQLAQAQAEIEDWRSKFQNNPRRHHEFQVPDR